MSGAARDREAPRIPRQSARIAPMQAPSSVIRTPQRSGYAVFPFGGVPAYPAIRISPVVLSRKA